MSFGSSAISGGVSAAARGGSDGTGSRTVAGSARRTGVVTAGCTVDSLGATSGRGGVEAAAELGRGATEAGRTAGAADGEDRGATDARTSTTGRTAGEPFDGVGRARGAIDELLAGDDEARGAIDELLAGDDEARGAIDELLAVDDPIMGATDGRALLGDDFASGEIDGALACGATDRATLGFGVSERDGAGEGAMDGELDLAACGAGAVEGRDT